MSDRLPICYLPGIDGIMYAGDVTLLGFQEHRTFQFPYPSAQSGDLIAMCDEVLAAIDQAGLEQVILFGESYGGALAQTFASRYPERVARLVLISTFLKHPAPLRGLFARACIRVLPKWLVMTPIKLVSHFTLLQSLTREQREHFYAGLEATSLKNLAARVRALHQFDRRAQPVHASIRSIWCWGTQDTLVGYRNTTAWLQAERPSDEYRVYDHAGHCIAGDARVRMIQDIRRFLELPPLSEADVQELRHHASELSRKQPQQRIEEARRDFMPS